MLYLDNASTTKIHKDVINEMNKCLNTIYGNSNSLYYDQALQAKALVETGRSQCSKLVSCNKENLIFTASGSESNNMIIKGLFFSYFGKKNKIISTPIEHDSVLKSLEFIKTLGAEVVYLDVNKDGTINPEDLKSKIDENTFLVTIMHANNEIGSINDIVEIGKICNDKNVFFHSDCTQSVGKVDINYSEIIGLSSISYSAHKIHGPKGIGALVVSNEIKRVITPLISGGEQEFGLRAGTTATHQVVGFGKAAEITLNNQKVNIKRLLSLENELVSVLSEAFGNRFELNSISKNKVPGIVNFQVKGINNQIFLKKISNDIAASAGSACGVSRPSYVLKAIGYSDQQISNSVRFSLSPYDNYESFKIFAE